MDLICDSNVWYDFQRGRLDPAVPRANEHRLILSPITYLEIVSGINEQNFEQRRVVCTGIIEHCDAIIDDPERHLSSLWGIPFPTVEVDWHDAILAVSEAASLEELTAGVENASGTQSRRTNLEVARQWRVNTYEHFCREIQETVDRFCPGYRAERQVGRAVSLPRQYGDILRAALQQRALHQLLIPATIDRVSALIGQTVPPPNEHDIARVHELLDPYISVYCEYIYDAATRQPPSPNDHGDFECFIYLQDNRRLWTSDRRWISLAASAGFSQWLFSTDQT